MSYPNYLDLRERTTSLAGLYAYREDPEPMSLATAGDTVRIYGSVFSANYPPPASYRLIHQLSPP